MEITGGEQTVTPTEGESTSAGETVHISIDIRRM